MSVQDVGATPRPCAAATGNFSRQAALWQHLTGIGFSGKSATGLPAGRDTGVGVEFAAWTMFAGQLNLRH